MVLAVLVSSLGFLSDLELLGGIMLRRARFVPLFCFAGGGLGSFLESLLKEPNVAYGTLVYMLCG